MPASIPRRREEEVGQGKIGWGERSCVILAPTCLDYIGLNLAEIGFTRWVVLVMTGQGQPLRTRSG